MIGVKRQYQIMEDELLNHDDVVGLANTLKQ